MNLIACALALYILVNVHDRLRLVNWKTAKYWAVLSLLAQSGLALWALYDGCTGTAAWWQLLLLLGVVAWLHLTRAEWRGGVPLHVQTGHGDLGPPELRRP